MPTSEQQDSQSPDQQQQQQQQQQYKLCSSCQSQFPLDPPAASVCPRCTDHPFHCIDYSDPPPPAPRQSIQRRQDIPVFQPDAAHEPLDILLSHTLPTHIQAFPLQRHTPQLTLQTADITPKHQDTFASPAIISRRPDRLAPPDPFTDITRLRMRSQQHRCLYPGATFQGTQKSGRNSYDVNVTIVDVDFASSFLCGYLRIRGLTDDWPELTTYFDAEIIGSRYGFLTRNWGANETEDLVHWSRFPAFRHVKNELRKPYLTMPDRDRGAVFMRWKERFLVPDHRVQDINGASFAGFYYVCVDFNPSSSSSSSSSSRSPLSTTLEEEVGSWPPSGLDKPEHSIRRRRDSSAHRGPRSPSAVRGPSVATMSGFYFHQNSEPYQQLSLCHVPERTSTSFEFR